MVTGTQTNTRWQKTFMGWIAMSRLPFQSVGIVPFILGTVLANKTHSPFNLAVFMWGGLAVTLIMLSTYFAGEFYDLEVDRLSAQMEKNRFSGGSQALVQGMVPGHHARIASYISLGLAGLIGLLLQFYYRTGAWTIPLGILGMIFGFFYSTEPLRWAKRGIGEIMIGFCYGWLPVAVSFYLQAGRIDPIIHWVSLPIAFSIFNVILINEFPDYPADLICKKANLVVRLGRRKASGLYIVTALFTLITYGGAVAAGLPRTTLVFYPFIIALSACTIRGMARGQWSDRYKLERMCAISILINILIAVSYILGLTLWS